MICRTFALLSWSASSISSSRMSARSTGWISLKFSLRMLNLTLPLKLSMLSGRDWTYTLEIEESSVERARKSASLVQLNYVIMRLVAKP